MRILLLSLSVAVASSLSPGIAAADPDTSEHEEVSGPSRFGAHQLAVDTRSLFTRPAHLDRAAWRRVAVIGAATGVLYAFRDDIRDFAQDHRTPGRDRFLQGARTMGKGAFAPGAALVAYGASFLTRDDREKETAFLLLESVAYSSLFAAGGQFVLATDRPRDGDRIRFFNLDGHGVSGDAAIAASVIAPLRRQYLLVSPEDGTFKRAVKRGLTGLLYAGAALTAYERVNEDAHWAPDAFLGMVTGLTVGGVLCDSHDEAKAARRVGWSTDLGSSGFGITMQIQVGRGPNPAVP